MIAKESFMIAAELREPRKGVVHVRFNGRSFDVPKRDLDLDEAASDRAVRAAVAAYMDVPVGRLAEYIVDRHEGGNWTVRPEAVFG